jgi:dTDP-4-amino-4,6-dideoxygalactose transaminase
VAQRTGSTTPVRQRWPAGVEVKVWHRYFGSVYGDEERQALADVLEQEYQTNGPQNLAFQAEFAAFSGAAHALAASSCTTALMLAGQLCGLRPGDEVVTTPLTFASTSQAILNCGATPVFVDVDARTFNIDPERVAASLTPRTRALFVVHLYGQCCDMERIEALAAERGLRVVADAAHVVGAHRAGRPAGSLGDAAAFSFHSSKQMTTLGEGGMLTTPHDAWAARARLLRSMGVDYGIAHPEPRDHWLPLPYEVDDPDGFIPNNYRMSEAQAAVGRAQLRKVGALNERRRQIARRYTEALAGIPGLITPYEDPAGVHVYYLYALLVDPSTAGFTRDDLMRALLRDWGVHTITGYPPVYWFAMYRKRGYTRGLCPMAERVYAQTLMLPLYAQMTDDDSAYVIQSVVQAAAALRSGGGDRRV